VFLRGVAIPDDGLETMAVIRGNLEIDTGAHAADSHALATKGIPCGIQPSALNH
jgi:hypothetical protein